MFISNKKFPQLLLWRIFPDDRFKIFDGFRIPKFGRGENRLHTTRYHCSFLTVAAGKRRSNLSISFSKRNAKFSWSFAVSVL